MTRTRAQFRDAGIFSLHKHKTHGALTCSDEAQ